MNPIKIRGSPKLQDNRSHAKYQDLEITGEDHIILMNSSQHQEPQIHNQKIRIPVLDLSPKTGFRVNNIGSHTERFIDQPTKHAAHNPMLRQKPGSNNGQNQKSPRGVVPKKLALTSRGVLDQKPNFIYHKEAVHTKRGGI